MADFKAMLQQLGYTGLLDNLYEVWLCWLWEFQYLGLVPQGRVFRRGSGPAKATGQLWWGSEGYCLGRTPKLCGWVG